MQIRFGENPYLDPQLSQAQTTAGQAQKLLASAMKQNAALPGQFSSPSKPSVYGDYKLVDAITRTVRSMRTAFEPLAKAVVELKNTQQALLQTVVAQQKTMNGMLEHLTSDEQGF